MSQPIRTDQTAASGASVVIRIEPGNIHERIEKARDTIIACWETWDGEAGQQAQVDQDPDSWFRVMEAQVTVVLLGMVTDP